MHGGPTKEQLLHQSMTKRSSDQVRYATGESVFSSDLMMAACQDSPHVSWWVDREDNFMDAQSHTCETEFFSSEHDFRPGKT